MHTPRVGARPSVLLIEVCTARHAVVTHAVVIRVTELLLQIARFDTDVELHNYDSTAVCSEQVTVIIECGMRINM